MRRRIGIPFALAALLAGPALIYGGYGLALYGDLVGPVRAEVSAGIRDLVLPKPRKLDGFVLERGAGASFGPDDLHGRWTFLSFGFTHCPDVCPFVLSNLADVRQHMAQLTAPDSLPQVVFVSVDPERDTPDHLAEYVAHFDPSFIGATGSVKELDSFVHQTGSYYRLGSKHRHGGYDVMHGAEIHVIDPKGRLFATLRPPLDPRTVTNQFSAIRRVFASDG